MKKIMSKKSREWSKFFLLNFFDHIRNLRQKLHKPTKFQKKWMFISETSVYRWGAPYSF